MRAESPAKVLALRSAAQLRQFVEERLYLARGLQDTDQSSGPLPDMYPHVRHLARREERITRAQLVALFADLDDVPALDDVEPLFLLVVQVPGGSALFDVDDLGDAEASVGVLGGDLHVDDLGGENLALLA